MDIQELSTELQRFADAQNMKMDVQAVLETMDAGDFVEINQAIDNSDNRTIMQILQKYRAHAMESYQYFSGQKLIESETYSVYDNMGYDELLTNYRAFVPGALHDCTHLTLSEMKTLVKEDITSALGNVLDSSNTANSGSASNVNPAVQAKMKQTELQKNAGNPSFNVTVPSGSGASTSVEQVMGVDLGTDPSKSLVVTKDPANANQVQVFGIDQVQPVQEDALDTLSAAAEGSDEGLRDSVSEDYQEFEEFDVYDEPCDSELPVQPEQSEDEIIEEILSLYARLKGLN